MRSSGLPRNAGIGHAAVRLQQGWLRWLAKLLLSLLLIALILRMGEPRTFWRTVQGLDGMLFLGAAALFLPGQLLAAYRWGYVLARLQRPLPFWLLVRHSLFGQLSALVLPGQLSGDVVRTVAVAQGQHGKVLFALSVAIDKAALLVAMAGVGLLGLAAVGPVSDLTALYWLTFLLFLLALLAFAVLCWYRPSQLPAWAVRLGERLPFGRRALLSIAELLTLPRLSLASALAVLALALALQVAFAAGSYLLALAMHISVPPVDWVSINALIGLVQILPLTIGGLGVREGAAAALLALYGVPVAQTTAYSLVGFFTGAMELYIGWLLLASPVIQNTGRRAALYLRQHVGLVAFLALTLLLGGLNLRSAPPLWWDEGWNLSVIRNWVELGLYGQLIAGSPVAADMITGFPALVPIALSFKLFGVGIAQGRLVGVLFMAGASALLYHLGLRLYTRRIAIGTLVAMLLLSGNPDTHAAVIGRQVLGEPAMLFYLLAGYLALLLTLQGRAWMISLAVLCWALALDTKLQSLPFWALSLAIPLCVAALQRRWKTALWLLVALLGSYAASKLLWTAWHWLVGADTLESSPITGLLSVTAVVTKPTIRVAALILVGLFGLPTLCGLIYAARRFVPQRNLSPTETAEDVIRLALLTFAGGWLAWYILLSAAWLRYLFPAIFVGSIFVSALLHDLTDGFNLGATLKRAASILTRRGRARDSLGALLATLLVVSASASTLVTLRWAYFVNNDLSVVRAAKYLNTETEPDALVETYNSELFFMLDRDYHYPPGQVHVELQRRNVDGPGVVIPYDPLAADPDYLVVGPVSRSWHLYDPVIASGAFRLRHVEGQYDIYERVR